MLVVDDASLTGSRCRAPSVLVGTVEGGIHQDNLV